MIITNDQVLQIAPLFNENGNDSLENQFIVGGNPTGICNLNNNKYSWVGNIYKTMMKNFWIPEDSNMVGERQYLQKAQPEEIESKQMLLSFLIFMDSFQTNNLPNIRNFITNGAIRTLLTIQEYQEAIHSQSYQYILENIYSTVEERDRIYNLWREIPNLNNRIKNIVKYANRFVENPTFENFKIVIMANYVLEGIYFYQGFNFFDQLAARHLFIHSQEQIDYIRKDELSHVRIFKHLILELFDYNKDRGMVQDIMGEAVENEIAWAHFIYGDRIMGISKETSYNYLNNLGNKRLSMINFDQFLPKTEDPYRSITQIEDKEEGETYNRKNFFETGVTEYSASIAHGGWEEV